MTTDNHGEVSRREFVSNSVKGAAALALGAQLVARPSSAEETGVPLRPLGRTGEQVSVLLDAPPADD